MKTAIKALAVAVTLAGVAYAGWWIYDLVQLLHRMS